MSNPFFGTSYPWKLPLAQELYIELVKACPNKLQAQQLVQNAGMQQAAISWEPPVMYVWNFILDNAVKEKRLEALLNLVLADNTLSSIHELVQRVKGSGQAPVSDVCTQLLLPGDVPFLNREKLRSALRRMREDTPRSILLVRGQPRSGKTMTLELVSAVAKERGDKVIYLYEENANRIDQVVSYLLPRLGTGQAPAPPQDTTDHAWYRQVGLDALERATRSNQRCWIVVDNLSPDPQGQPRMDREVLALFHQFALLMADPEFSRYFRLVFLDYPSAPNHPPSRLKKTLLEEDMTGPLGDVEIGAFVKSVLGRWHQQYSEEDLQTLIQTLMKNAEEKLIANPEPGRTQAIYESLAEWVAESVP